MELKTDGALTLVIGWKSGYRLKLAKVLVSTDVADEFRAIAASTKLQLDAREEEVWAPDADLSPETYLALPVADLGDAPALATEHGDRTLATALLEADDIAVIAAHDLPTNDLFFYSFTVGDSAQDRTVYLRRFNARRGLRTGRLMSSYHDVLQKIEDPVFAFDDFVDLVLNKEQVAILSQTAFVSLFRGQETLVAQVPKWTAELTSHVAIASRGQERLTAKAIRDSRVKTRLEAIVKRGHLASVAPDRIRSRMAEVGLDPAALIDQSGDLVLEEEDIPAVLQFLNEDLFVGALTDIGFRADKKAAR